MKGFVMRLFISICLLVMFAGCGSKETASKKESLNSTELEQLRAVSSKMIQTFGSSLKSELMSAVNDGGFGNAVSVCEEKAPAIAKAHSVNGWSIQRVTDKNRSAENLADAHQLEVLQTFRDTSLQLEFFDEWVSIDNDSSYYFYKPIYIGKLCLKCHGQETDVAAEIKPVLKEKYPNDSAVGYADGDLRGMFVVKVSAAEGMEYLRSLPVDSL